MWKTLLFIATYLSAPAVMAQSALALGVGVGVENSGGIGVLAKLDQSGGAHISAAVTVPKFGADFGISDDIWVNRAAFNNLNIRGSRDRFWPYAPVTVLGYQRAFGRSWGMTADIGAIYTRDYTPDFSIPASERSGQVSQLDLGAELADSHARLGRIAILPFVKLGVSFEF